MLERCELVVFDMAGTTVDDRIDGASLVVRAFVQAFDASGLPIGQEAVARHRGKAKLDAVRGILREHGGDPGTLEGRAREIHADFLSALERAVDGLGEIDGTTETFRTLRSHGVRVAVGSGFPARVVERLVDGLGWAADGLVDHVTSSERVGAGRPDPGMILQAMRALGVTDPRRVLKVGDTVVDVEEGKNAGTWTAAVLTGGQDEDALRRAGPDFILGDVRDVPGVPGVLRGDLPGG